MEYKCHETYGSRFCVNCGNCFFDGTEQELSCADNDDEESSGVAQQV